MDHIEFSGHVVHMLSLRRVECEDISVMEFNLVGFGVQFTDKDFVLVTGLSFGGHLSEHDAKIREIKSTHIYETYLKNATDVDTSKLFTYFMDAQFKTPEDAIKMALIYFLNCGLIGLDRKVRIDLKFVALVEYLEKFNKYLWGKLIYKKRVASLYAAFSKHKTDEESNNGKRNWSGTYDLKGFPVAFQVWAYEAIPILAEGFATRREDPSLPWILRWKASKHPGYDDLHRHVFSKNNGGHGEGLYRQWIYDPNVLMYSSPPIVEPVVEPTVAEPMQTVGDPVDAPLEDQSAGPSRIATIAAHLDLEARIVRLEHHVNAHIDLLQHHLDAHLNAIMVEMRTMLTTITDALHAYPLPP